MNPHIGHRPDAILPYGHNGHIFPRFLVQSMANTNQATEQAITKGITADLTSPSPGTEMGPHLLVARSPNSSSTDWNSRRSVNSSSRPPWMNSIGSGTRWGLGRVSRHG